MGCVCFSLRAKIFSSVGKANAAFITVKKSSSSSSSSSSTSSISLPSSPTSSMVHALLDLPCRPTHFESCEVGRLPGSLPRFYFGKRTSLANRLLWRTVELSADPESLAIVGFSRRERVIVTFRFVGVNFFFASALSGR